MGFLTALQDRCFALGDFRRRLDEIRSTFDQDIVHYLRALWSFFHSNGKMIVVRNMLETT